MDAIAKLTVGAPPGFSPRLIDGGSVVEELRAYRDSGGYAALTDPAGLLTAVTESGLRGRGGAAFPLGVKLHAVRDHCGPGVRPVVVGNGEEGEPASAKDRWLLRYRPHRVLDGLRLAAAMVDADRAYLYLSDRAAADAVDSALAELDGTESVGVPIEVVTIEPGYVAGEESAAVRAINGGPAKPTDKPPRVFQVGVDRRPTLVSNVETLANLPFILRHGADAYRAVGTTKSPGTFLATVSGGGREPMLYELPHSISFADLLALHQISPDDVTGALLGGYFSGLINRRVLNARLDHETLRALGSGLGCGAIGLLTHDECPVAVAASVLEYFDRENAGQCGSCFNGTAAMSAAVDALRDDVADESDMARLRRWSIVLRGRGACGTLDAATNMARTLLDEFPAAVSLHRGMGCEVCTATPYFAERPFEVEAVSLV